MRALDFQTLDEPRILRSLRTQWIGRSLRIVDECGSTNDVAGKLAGEDAVRGLVVIAETQTAGRGRNGREWCSPRGGVWLSILVRPHEHLSSISVLPLVGALGIAASLSENWKVKARVRWPNDVMINKRKVAGVLVESKSKGNQLTYAVIGLGVNANCNTSKIESISNTATSLFTILGERVNREDLICAILLHIENFYESLSLSADRDILQTLRSLDCSHGNHVKVKLTDREVEGTFDDYSSLGEVRIMTADGFESIRTEAVVSVDYQSN